MRFLFVLDVFVATADQILHELNVDDVKVQPVKKTERGVSSDVLKDLTLNTGIAICGIDRGYRKSLTGFSFGYQSKDFRKDDLQLREWLTKTNKNTQEHIPRNPSEIFKEIAKANPNLLVSSKALKRADEIAHHRWSFVEKSAHLLARFSQDEDLGSFTLWQEKYGVKFAPNGEVYFTYTSENEKIIASESSWHLKEGDNTSAQAAARIYFRKENIDGTPYVLIAYVGPHPSSGTYTAIFRLETPGR